MATQRVILLACLAACVPAVVLGHGLITRPLMRVGNANGPTATTCAHCYTSGGTDAQSAGRTLQWEDRWPSNAVHTTCGDPPGEEGRAQTGSGYPVTSMAVGDDNIIKVEFAITTNHWGRISLRVFPNPDDIANGNEEAGISLERADGAGPYIFLPLEMGTNGDGMTYEGPATHADWSEGWGEKYSSLWKWPGLPCENQRCVMHMFWVTGHSCTPPGVPAANVKYYGEYPAPPCGDPGIWPEMFWNCADFTVTRTVQLSATVSDGGDNDGDNDGNNDGNDDGNNDGNNNGGNNNNNDCKKKCCGRPGGTIPQYAPCGDEEQMPYNNCQCETPGNVCSQQTGTMYAQCRPKPEVGEGWQILYEV